MAKKKQKKANAQQGRGDAGVAYLSYVGPGERSIGGIGDFAKGKEPVAVENSIARQYESKDMRALGWRVEWRKQGYTVEAGELTHATVGATHASLPPGEGDKETHPASANSEVRAAPLQGGEEEVKDANGTTG